MMTKRKAVSDTSTCPKRSKGRAECDDPAARAQTVGQPSDSGTRTPEQRGRSEPGSSPMRGNENVSSMPGATSRRYRNQPATPPKRWDLVKAYVKKRNILRHGWHHDPDTIQPLCEECALLDLSFDLFIISEPPRGESMRFSHKAARLPLGKQSLGPLKEIIRKSVQCPLCKLIMKSLAEQPNTYIGRLVASQLESDHIPEYTTAVGEFEDAQCLVSWQLDGRERVTNRDGQEIDQPRTRRLLVEWPKSSYADAHFVLVFPQNLAFVPSPLFLGRLQTSVDQSKREQIATWLDICRKNHEPHVCQVQHDEKFEDLRKESYFGVVDLRDMCLTALPEGEKYVALSYTWGKPSESGEPRLETKLANVESLKRPNGIREHQHELPRTITDAIDLARKLKYRYIWIDSLCILQGEEEIWELNASRMDSVYGNADLTICAADGKGADHGLIALHALPSRFSWHAAQHTEEVKKDLRLMVSYPSETYVGRSTWNTRAWTFQERILSKRCLIFAEGKVYFQCRTTTMSEDIHAETAKRGWSIELLYGPLLRFNKIDEHPVDVYKYSVAMYTDRKLSKPKDVLAAFGGIGKAICSRLGGEPIYGLPNSHFDWALLWSPDRPPQRRTQPNETKLFFPSWAWCGWMETKMTYHKHFVDGAETNLHEWLTTRTWITWYIRDGQGNLRLLWDHSLARPSDHPMREARWRGYRHLGPSSNADQAAANAVSPSEAAIDGMEAEHPAVDRYLRKVDPHAGLRDTFHKTMPKYPFQVRMVDPGQKSTRPEEQWSDQRFLQFWTWSAHFYIRAEKPDQPFGKKVKGAQADKTLKRFGIVDRNSDLVGSLMLDAKVYPSDDNADETKARKFIAISMAKDFCEEEYNMWGFVDAQARDRSEWYCYNVLLLEDDDEIPGVERRAGLGKIFKSSFSSTAIPMRVGDDFKQKRWEEIILG